MLAQAFAFCAPFAAVVVEAEGAAECPEGELLVGGGCAGSEAVKVSQREGPRRRAPSPGLGGVGGAGPTVFNGNPLAFQLPCGLGTPSRRIFSCPIFGGRDLGRVPKLSHS